MSATQSATDVNTQSMEYLAVSVRDEGTSSVVVLDGEIDADTAPDLRVRLLELIAEGRTRLVLDFGSVTFLDSSALGVLIGAQRRVRALDGYLDVVTNRPLVVKLFRLTGLDKVIALHDSVEQAVAWQASLSVARE